MGMRETPAARFVSPEPSQSLLSIEGQTRVVAWGPTDIGDTSLGLRSTIWGAYIDFDGRVFTAQRIDGAWGDWTERFTLIKPVSNVLLTFDLQGFPIIAYVAEDKDLGVWYRIDGTPQLVVLGKAPSQFSPVFIGQTVPDVEYAEFGDVMMAYGDADGAVTRLASEGFQTEHRLKLTGSGNYGRLWVSGMGMTDRARFSIQLKG